MNSKLKQIIKQFLLYNTVSNNTEWQSIRINENNPIVSLNNIFFTINNIEGLNQDMPWSEDHFQERINGKPINPGNEYKNWPYYKSLDNDELFRVGGKFSHNYMERYWCKGFKGIRFNYGDLNDIIERLKLNTYTRQAFLSVWHPEDQSNHGERVPCTIGYWFNRVDDKLEVTYLIRSCDIVRHFKNDLYMTYRLLEHVSTQIGLQPGKMNVWIGNLHCFKSDLYTLNKMIK